MSVVSGSWKMSELRQYVKDRGLNVKARSKADLIRKIRETEKRQGTATKSSSGPRMSPPRKNATQEEKIRKRQQTVAHGGRALFAGRKLLSKSKLKKHRAIRRLEFTTITKRHVKKSFYDEMRSKYKKYREMDEATFWGTFKVNGRLTVEFSHRIGVYVMRAVYLQYKSLIYEIYGVTKRSGIRKISAMLDNMNEFLRSRKNVVMKLRSKNVGYYKSIEELFATFLSKHACEKYGDVTFLTKTKCDGGVRKRTALSFYHMTYYWNGVMLSLNSDAEPALPNRLRRLMYRLLSEFYDYQGLTRKKGVFAKPAFA